MPNPPSCGRFMSSVAFSSNDGAVGCASFESLLKFILLSQVPFYLLLIYNHGCQGYSQADSAGGGCEHPEDGHRCSPLWRVPLPIQGGLHTCGIDCVHD